MILMRQQRRVLRACLLSLFLGCAAMGLGGCATLDTTLDWLGFGGRDSGPETPESLVMDAMDAFNHGRYRAALKGFEEVRDRYPFSDVAMLAALKSADANFHLNKYVEARILYEEFEANHPTNEAIPYVLFQIGLCSYRRIGSQDRDPGNALEAVQAFERLNRAFPASPYFAEATARIGAARDFLAQHEFSVASFYLRTDEDQQAKGRLEFLLAVYPETSVVPQAGELLAKLNSGQPLEKSWRRFVPTVSLPEWQSLKSAFGVLPGAGAAPGPME